MKPTPTVSMHSATCSGVSCSATPAASSRSALPERLETARLPCLATLPPAAATTKVQAVEMLKVPVASPPVPTMSTTCSPSTFTPVASSRITCAAAAISSTVSPFMRRPIRNPPICAGVASPVMIRRITVVICSGVRSRRSVTVRMASCMFIGGGSVQGLLEITRRAQRHGEHGVIVMSGFAIVRS